MLQSQYPNWSLPNWENQATVNRLWQILWLADDFFCQSTQVKSFVYWSANFQGFCHWSSVGNDRLMIDRQSADFFINFNIAQMSSDCW